MRGQLCPWIIHIQGDSTETGGTMDKEVLIWDQVYRWDLLHRWWQRGDARWGKRIQKTKVIIAIASCTSGSGRLYSISIRASYPQNKYILWTIATCSTSWGRTNDWRGSQSIHGGWSKRHIITCWRHCWFWTWGRRRWGYGWRGIQESLGEREVSCRETFSKTIH